MELTQEQINDIVTAVFSLMESQGMLPSSKREATPATRLCRS